MHQSARKNAKMFADKYICVPNPSILDVGSYNVNGTLKECMPADAIYVGLDTEEGPNVDCVIKDYTFPFNDNEFDYVVSSSCFEHCNFFWLIFLEMVRCLKPNGLIYINSPSSGAYHAYPRDYYRFYKDTGIALRDWANYSGYKCELLESYIDNSEGWRDNVVIIKKL